MNNDLTQKEKEIQEAFDTVSFELDTSAIWDNIEPQLTPVKKNRKAIWWMMAGFLVGILSIVGYNYLDNTSMTALSTPSVINPIAEAPIQSNTSLNNASSITASNTNSQASINNSNKTLTQKYNNPTQSEITSSNLNTQNQQSKISHNSDTYNQSIITQNTIESQTNSSIHLNNPLGQKTFFDVNTKEDESRSLSIEVENIIRNVSVIKQLDRITASAIIGNQLNISAPQIKPLKNTSWRSYFTVLSGINLSSQKVFSKDNEGFDRSQFDRESGLLGSSSLFTYGKQNQKGWRWNIGLSHSRLTSRYAYEGSSTISSTIQGIESITINTDGNSINNEGSLNVNTTQYYDVIWHKSHDFVDLNIGIGKEVFKSGNFSISADLTAGYNLWSRHAGYFFTEGNEKINKFENGENNPYQNQGISLGGRLQLAYDINNISIALSPFSSFALQNSTKSNNYYQIKNSHYGIQLGLVYTP